MDIIPVVYHHDPDGWWANSPDLAGWTATAETVDDLRSLVEEGVRFYLERDNVVALHLLGPEVPSHARMVFDFVQGTTVTGGAAGGRSHWETQPA